MYALMTEMARGRPAIRRLKDRRRGSWLGGGYWPVPHRSQCDNALPLRPQLRPRGNASSQRGMPRNWRTSAKSVRTTL